MGRSKVKTSPDIKRTKPTKNAKDVHFNNVKDGSENHKELILTNFTPF